MRLAERVDLPRLVADAIRQGAGRPVIAAPLADAILKKAHDAGNEDLGDSVERALAARMSPSSRREFRTRSARMREGPDAALALLRRTSGPRRTPIEAAGLGAALIDAGQSEIGLRYLRRCHQRWPASRAIKAPLLRAYLQGGHLEAARAWLEDLARQAPAGVPDALRLSFAMHAGEMEEACAILKTQISEGRRRAGDLTLLRVLLSLDRLEEAEEVARAIRAEPGRAVRQGSHFSIRLLGAILNEFRLYRATSGRDGDDTPSPAQVASQYFAAKTVLDGWRDSEPWQPTNLDASSVPRHIFQYWNTERIPDAVADIMQSWQSVTDWTYRRFDRRGAIAWLRETLGEDHARAFRLANNVAEECDFLRMCLLLVEGGVYVDADDKRVGSLEDLSLLGSGLVLFVEPSLGSLSNNVILAPKGHPVLERAVGM
ncbi:tetratricopeptide repeat protein, partial [Cribrihabitans sp. XS_ASV171]